MSRQLSSAIAAGNIAEAATLALAQARLGVLEITELIGVAGLLAGQGKPEQAIALYRLWLQHCDTPLLYAAWYNLAVLQTQTGDPRGAEQSYRNALAIRADFTEAQLGLGALLELRRQPDAALALWREALERLDSNASANPNAASAGSTALQLQLLKHIGRLAELQQHYPETEQALTRSLLLDPAQPDVIRHWLQLRQRQCSWPVLAALPGLDQSQLLDAASLPSTLSACDDPAQQLVAARRHAGTLPQNVPALADAAGYNHRRLRIGYLAPDFGNGDAALLSAELHALHDRALVEVYGFCWSGEDNSALRERAAAGMDHYLRVAGISDLQAAELIRAHEIDILVDLHGLAAGARPAILAYRPAPVQIAWLGYPGTSAMAAVDYVLADSFVLPPELTPYFTEQPLYLPHSFQINDRQRKIGPALQRAECGLPEQGFVFCCFNAQQHLTPEQFAVWMRILLRVPDSVLWLAVDGEPARDHLRVAALRHGLPSERLVFAEDASPATRMARCRLAGLFLDTLPYSAGAAASEALWAGLPVLSCAGRSFGGRVAGSLLHAAGLPELVTASQQEYEELAVKLALSARKLTTLRKRLAKQRDSCALFDTPQLLRSLEQLYLRVARGTLQLQDSSDATTTAVTTAEAAVPKTAAQAAAGPTSAPQQDLAQPLVSILIAAGYDDSGTKAAARARARDAADALERTLQSAIDQHYGQVEIIISDSSGGGGSGSGSGDIIRDRIRPWLARHPQLRYSRAPGLTPSANLDRCLALALGQYIAVAPAGDTLHPDKLARMLQFYLRYPNLGLVIGWRQPLDADGQPLPSAPVFGVETAVSGASLAEWLLSSAGGPGDALCEPGALLLRRDALGAGFGRYMGHSYRALSGVATALSALAGRDCVYLPEALGTCRAAPVAAQDDARDDAAQAAADTLERTLEALRLLYGAHAQQLFLTDVVRFKELLAARLAALATLLSAQHSQLAGTAALEDIQQVLRHGYQLLLA